MPHRPRFTDSDHACSTQLSSSLALLLAIGAGLAVACLYYNQPLLGVLGNDLSVPAKAAGLIPTLTQLGYALGILLLAPLGDRHDRRQVIRVKSVLLVVALLIAGWAPSLGVLLPASLMIGVTATLAQDIVPTAAALAPEQTRGKMVGVVMTGLLTGILLSRVASGLVAEHFGWRAMFYVAAASIVLIGILLQRCIPPLRPSTEQPYFALLASLRGLWRQHQALRQAALAQGLLSVGFSAFWSTLAVMLHGAPFFIGTAGAGLFGFAGAAGALAAPLAGHLADRRGPEIVTQVGAGVAAAAFLLLAVAATWPARLQLTVLALGAVLFDLGVQASLIAHQSVIYRLDPAARSRLNAVLFVCMFIGMSVGSGLGSWLLAGWGWVAVTGLATMAALAALAVRCSGGRRQPGEVAASR